MGFVVSAATPRLLIVQSVSRASPTGRPIIRSGTLCNRPEDGAGSRKTWVLTFVLLLLWVFIAHKSTVDAARETLAFCSHSFRLDRVQSCQIWPYATSPAGEPPCRGDKKMLEGLNLLWGGQKEGMAVPVSGIFDFHSGTMEGSGDASSIFHARGSKQSRCV